MESFFKIRERGSTVAREVAGGMTAFLAMAYIVAGIPFTYSITDGIGLGFVAYIVVMTVLGRARQVKPLMWVAGLAFLIMFVVR